MTGEDDIVTRLESVVIADLYLRHGIREAVAEIKRLRHSLAVYVHAHETGNSVPPHIESEAKALCKEATR